MTFTKATIFYVKMLFFAIANAISADAYNLPLYWWHSGSFINFGDQLSEKIVERITGKTVEVYDEEHHAGTRKLLAIGSIMSYAKNGDVIWGTGVNGKSPLAAYQFVNLEVHAVRGPLTRDFLMQHFNISCPEIYGDPTLLLPRLFPEFQRAAEPLYEYLIVPHFSEQHLYPKDLYPNVVYPTDPWDTVIKAILNSKFVVAGAMSGAIVAEAFGIPARILISPASSEDLFKYQDYYLGTGRPHFKIAYSLQDALEMGGESPVICDLDALYQAFPKIYFLRL